MANAVEEALSRASAEQREQAMAAIQEARRTFQNANVQVYEFPDEAARIARKEQAIAEAKSVIPFETMVDVDEISPPRATPPLHGRADSTVINLHPDMHADIESVQRSGGDNYLEQNAMDKAMAREAQPIPSYEPPQQALGR